MKVIKFPNTTEVSTNPKVIALGKFESLHLGHKKLLAEAKRISEEKGYEFMIMLFSERPENNILSFDERLMFLKEFNPDILWEFTPKQENFNVTKDEFQELLITMNVKDIVVGSDFRYGNQRAGDVESLKEKFEVSVLNKDEKSTSEVVTSIINSDFVKFKDLMGYYFFYEGEVVRGKGNGKKFNMPTANINYPAHKIEMPQGIYHSYVIYDGQRLPSLTSVSFNPTVNGETLTYETYILNFDKDIYGEFIYVEIIEKFRDPIKFDSIEELIEQLEKDKITAKEFFKL